jgi:DAACS family dicarboxylate/amino acid:cation (Na+ or H+) symporter
VVNLFLGGEDRRVAWLVNNITEPVGTLFLRLLLMAVAPLVFSSLVVGDMTAATYVARSEGYELF